MEENNKKVVKEHIQEKIIVDYCMIPTHDSRNNKEELNRFEKAKHQMKKDGHACCFICGCESTLENHIEYHHFLVEDCLNNDADMNKLWELAKIFDLYGYANKATSVPVDCNCEMNLMPLCHNHHISAEGIHNNTFSTFIIQKLLKNDLSDEDDPVPDAGKLEILKKEYKNKILNKNNKQSKGGKCNERMVN